MDDELYKLNLIKKFYHQGKNNILFGSRTIFDNSDFRLVTLDETNTKIVTFIEVKKITSSTAVINFGFDSNYINKLTSFKGKMERYLMDSFSIYLNTILKQPNLKNIKTYYLSLHNSIYLLISDVIPSIGFTHVMKKNEILRNRLSNDGIHTNLKFELKKS